VRVINLDLTDEETAALLRELEGIIDGDRYFLSPGIKILKAIRAKSSWSRCANLYRRRRKQYAPPRATAAQRRRKGR
jgi:hypothetical protein